MKRMTAFLLALIIAISCFTISAFAGSETYSGTYNGYSYTCSALITNSPLPALSLSMYYGQSSAQLKISVVYTYVTADGPKTGKTTVLGCHNISKNPLPNNLLYFTGSTQSYYVNGTKMLTFSISA